VADLAAPIPPDPWVVERAVRRLAPEVPPLPGALARGAAELAVCEPDAEDPSAAGGVLCDGDEFAPAEPAFGVAEPGVAGEGELAAIGVPADFGAEEVCPAGAGIEGSVSMGSAATGAGPAGPELL
jgi:hypothetical protein